VRFDTTLICESLLRVPPVAVEGANGRPARLDAERVSTTAPGSYRRSRYPEGMATISFARGIPAPECLAVEDLAVCARAALERDGHTILSYGPSPGYLPLREWLAARHGVDVSRIFITNGSLQGFVFLAQRLAPGKRVLVERPTYDRPLKILQELGADTVALDCDDEGLDPDALEAALRSGEKPAFLYLIPTFQNPSGRTLGVERRRRIVELAAEHELLVLEDDPYGLVRFEGEAPPSLYDLSGGEIAYSSSFSKTIAPGLRVGWFVLPEGLARQIEAEATSTYITPVLLGQATVHEFVSRGLFEPNLERVTGLLRARRDAMLAALDSDLPGVAATRPEGGYFLWLDLDGTDAGPLLAEAQAAGVTFVKGTDFGGGPDTLRLAYSFVSPAEIAEGVARLASLLPAAVRN
jgi:2-aminoadipate transaminase